MDHVVDHVLAAVLSRGAPYAVVFEIPHYLVAVLSAFFADAPETEATIGLDVLPRMREAPVDGAAHPSPWEGLDEQDVSLFADFEELENVDEVTLRVDHLVLKKFSFRDL